MRRKVKAERQVDLQNEATRPPVEFEAEARSLVAGETGAVGVEEFEPNLTVYRPERAGIRKVLGDLEADVMEYVWENSGDAGGGEQGQGITVREVYEAFRLRRVIAYTTVMSTMARLARKHLLHAHKVDNAYVYKPSLSKDEFIDNFVGRILENLLVSFAHSTETHLQRLSAGDKAEKITALKARLAGVRGPGAELDRNRS